MKSPAGKYIRFSLFLGLAVFLIYWVFKDVNFSHMIQEFKKANYFWLFVSFLMGFAAFVSRAMRWQLLFEPLGYKSTTIKTLTSVCLGYFANIAFPRAGEVVRCTVVNQLTPIPVATLIGTVVLERVIDLLVLILLLSIVILGSFGKFGHFFFDFFSHKFGHTIQQAQSLNPLLVVVVIVVAALLIFFSLRKLIQTVKRKKNHKWVSKPLEFFKNISQGLSSLLRLKRKWTFVGHTLFIWVMYVGMTYVCFFAYEPTHHLQFFDSVFLTVVGGFGMSAPVQGGFGAFHFLIEKALTLFDINPVVDTLTGQVLYSPGLVFATLVHTTQFVLVLIAGLISLVVFYILKRKYNA